MRRKLSIGHLVMLSLLLVGSCGLADNRICGTPPPLTDLVDSNDATKGMIPNRDRANNCVTRWAYRLAKSSDDAKTVAEAVVARCSNDIAAAMREQDKPWIDNYQKDALFFVVQARAGRCKVV
jgi:hypothetical protein